MNSLAFRKIDSTKSKIQQLMKEEPLIEMIRERFKFEITNYLTSLKDEGIEKESSFSGNIDGLRSRYLGVGKQFAVTQMVFDVSNSVLKAEHLLLLNEIIFGSGAYRENDTFILNVSGEEQKTPGWQDVPDKINALLNWYVKAREEGKMHPIHLASMFHHRFTTIHPFEQGNGRIARLVLNIVLMQHGYLPVLIDPGERQAYYIALEKADRGELTQLVDFFIQKQEETQKELMEQPDFLSIQAKLDMEGQLTQIKGKERCIVLTEDSATDHLLGAILEASGFNLSETNIISYEGCSKLASANLFAVFLKDKMPGVHLLVHRDRDYLTDREVDSIRGGFSKIDANFFVTHGTDVESHFVSAEHIHACHSEISVSSAQKMINGVFRGLKQNSIDYLRKKEFGGYRPEKYTHLNHAFIDLVEKNQFRFTHGKTALKIIKEKIHRNFHIRADIEKPSTFLRDKYLSRIADKIWNVER